MIFKELFKAVKERLMPAGSKALIKYYSYQWGQLDYDEDGKDPLICPMALFALMPSTFKSGGRGSQQAEISFQLQLIFQSYAEADSRASAAVMDRALGFFDLFEAVYALLHNWTPDIDGVSTFSCQGIVGDPIANGDKVAITLGFTTTGKITTNVKDLEAVVQGLEQSISLPLG